MSARDWIEKDFYRELGVSSDASAEEIKKAYRKLARELHPDANPGDTKAEARFKAVSEAYGVLSDAAKRKQYDEARRLFAGGGGFPGGFGGGGGFDVGDLFGRAGAQPGGMGGGLGDLLGGLFNRRGGGAASATRPRRGEDVETDVRIDFTEAVRGATVPMRLSSPAACGTCGGSGARPGTTPRTCANCGGAGLVTRSQGAFAFSEPCQDCRGTGRVVDDPCPECGGDGVSTRTRTLTIRIPAGVDDGQRIRLAGQGEPGRNGGPTGDLYVRVHVNPHPVFGRAGNDLTVTVPVTFPELALGTTLTVPTLEGKVTVKVPAGTASGRVMRAKGKGIARRDGQVGDLLITLQVAVPNNMDAKAREALENYALATAGHDPRPDLNALLEEKGRS
ncbi:molecular chaperone DnaJ [Saccharothrix coeruleofusca]|uniref:Chaperone protein DnaJ n=1 Tax=Saccharothrix coeruleofusca TaxID=33919 RepID=A0A918ASR3_9PSEU|nr:molecular chaperone DnaJ [Saccharothrix coeruleofusca]MBP2339777.1 molecular chaperone DnaJ [Saccharothrix coeruleofusca]GGP80219.1 chaperone protein DnaJ [Saccharothrix coeruleofusca]